MAENRQKIAGATYQSVAKAFNDDGGLTERTPRRHRRSETVGKVDREVFTQRSRGSLDS